MPVNIEALMEALATMAENKNLRAVASESLKGGLVTGLSAVLGGILLGPVGLAVGGAIGGTASALSAKGKFQSVCIILRNLNENQKSQLYLQIQRAFSDVGVTDVATIAMLIMSHASFEEIALREVGRFLNGMNLKVTSG